MRPLAKLFLLNALAALSACGAPGSDDVFTRRKPKAAALDSDTVKIVPQFFPTIATRAYAGYYRRVGDDQQFQPCGTTRPLEITAPPVARLILKDAFRWNAVWQGAPLYAVFEGAIVTDTVRADSTTTDSSKVGPRTRFYMVDVKSMRNWRDGDCGGMRIPKTS